MSGEHFDALLVVAFGGPQAPDEIRPFLEHVLRGRPVPASRIDAVAEHYQHIGGRSPLVELTEKQRVALEAQLASRGVMLPIELGMWHSRPFLLDALRKLHALGKRRVLAVVMAAFHDRSTMARYEGAVAEALRELGDTRDTNDSNDTRLELSFLQAELPYPVSSGFLDANADRVRAALAQVPSELREQAELVFTAHSVPVDAGHASGYVALYEESARAIAARVGFANHQLAYQSRSGSPREPWLEPDIVDVIHARAAAGARALVLAPIGFVCDHVEVLYDLDIEAMAAARAHDVFCVRALTVMDHPAYIAALADDVLRRLG